MTPLPKRRWSTRRQGKKRAGFSVASKSIAVCKNCGKEKVSHQVCPSCGFYNGEQIITLKKDKKIENKV